MIARLTFLILAGVVLASLSMAGEPLSEESGWVPPPYQKVVGYRFRLPSDGAEGPVPSGFSLLKNGSVDVPQLEQLKQKSAELTVAQTSKLLAAFNGERAIPSAACYDPHHLFLFYSDQGTVVAAIEVCFSCTGVREMPAISEARWHRHDFASLAKLVDELGLWQEKRTVMEWEKATLSHRK